MRLDHTKRFATAFAAILPVAAMSVALALPAAAQNDSADAPAAAPITTQRIDAFIERYRDAVERRDRSAINRCVDIDAILSRSLAAFPLKPRERSEVKLGMKQSFDWGDTIIESLGLEGHYRFLRVHEVDGRPRALFRLINGDGGLNYHDLHLRETGDGEITIDDCYIYLAGEDLSETFRRGLEIGLAARDSAASHERAAHFREYQQFVALIQAGEFSEALGFYREMSAATRADKSILILRLQAAMSVSIEDIIEASDEYLRLYPDDAGASLYKIDPCIFTERFDDAIEAIEEVRSAVEDDAYLDSMIAGIHTLREDWPQAARFAAAAIRKEPSLEDPYWTALTASLAQRDHAATGRIMLALMRGFDYAFDDLTQFEEYAHFVESEAYADFMSQAGRIAEQQVKPKPGS